MRNSINAKVAMEVYITNCLFMEKNSEKLFKKSDQFIYDYHNPQGYYVIVNKKCSKEFALQNVKICFP